MSKRFMAILLAAVMSLQVVACDTEESDVEVFPITIEEHITLLREAGFKSVDILWTSYLRAGFCAM